MKGIVYMNKIRAGTLEQLPGPTFRFTYDDSYLSDPSLPPVSITLPKSQKEFTAPVLFPFFSGLLSEGINKDLQCRLLHLDEDDEFRRLLKTAGNDTIGAVTIVEEP